MNITRQDHSSRTQRYDFSVADRTGWEMVYSGFDYPSEKDKPKGAVRASLVIQERYPNNFPRQESPRDTECFNDTIFLKFDGTITRWSDHHIGYSPVIAKFIEMDKGQRDEIRRNLSDEARSLFDKGLEGYPGDLGPQCVMEARRKDIAGIL